MTSSPRKRPPIQEGGGGASWGEGSRKREESNLLTLEEILRCDVLPVERILVVRFDTATSPEGYAGNRISLLDGGGVLGKAGSGKGRHDSG